MNYDTVFPHITVWGSSFVGCIVPPSATATATTASAPLFFSLSQHSSHTNSSHLPISQPLTSAPGCRVDTAGCCVAGAVARAHWRTCCAPHTIYFIPFISHHSSHSTHLTPLITQHSSHTTHHTALISHYSFHTTYLIPNAYKAETAQPHTALGTLHNIRQFGVYTVPKLWR